MTACARSASESRPQLRRDVGRGCVSPATVHNVDQKGAQLRSRRTLRTWITRTAAGVAIIGLIVAVGLLVWSWPRVEGRIVLATGGSDGAYELLASTYQHELADNGVTLELRPELQGPEIFRGLHEAGAGRIDGGIVKGGLMASLTGRLASVKARSRHETEAANTESVGRLFLEPIWVFTRGSLPITSLRDLVGHRILTGARQSGSRRIVLQLLRANGVNSNNSTLADQELTDDGHALTSGEADAAILILPAEAERIQKLLRVPDIRLMDFSPEAGAYTSRFPALSKVVLYQGCVEFEPLIPSADITLLATSAALVVRNDLHPALVALLAHAVIHNPKSSFDTSGDPVLFYRAGQFPTADDPEYDVSKEVRLAYKTGELPFLLRFLAPLNHRFGLPFSLTTFANAYGVQTVLLLIPALTIILPLVRLAPSVYRWAVRQRLLYWYHELKVLERSLDLVPASGDQSMRMVQEIERIDAAVRRIHVPREFYDRLYDLRVHIDLVQRRISQRRPVTSVAAE